MKEFSDSTYGIQEIAQTFIWSWESIILSIGYFEGPTEVQLNSWWKTVSLWSITVWYCSLILLKGHWKFLRCLISNFNDFQKTFEKEFSDNTDEIQGIAQTLRWLCKPIILSIRYSEGSTEVHLNNLWKTASLWSISSHRMEAKFT